MLDLIQNESLINFVKELKIKNNDKDFLISKIPHLDMERRKALLETLINIKLLQSEEEDVVKKIGRFWRAVKK